MNVSYPDSMLEHMRQIFGKEHPVSDFAGGTIPTEAFKVGQSVLFWWHDEEAKKMRVIEGKIMALPTEENDKYVLEDADFEYPDIAHKDLIRIMKEPV